MKTNQILTRTMGDYDVIQRTSDSYFDANALLRKWNSNPENAQRKMEAFLESSNTKDFMDALTDEINLGHNSPKIGNQIVKKSKTKSGKAGRPIDQVWMHPYLFIDFAMWLNPSFKVKVIKFVYDELIKYRNDAGDAYREMCLSVQIDNCQNDDNVSFINGNDIIKLHDFIHNYLHTFNP